MAAIASANVEQFQQLGWCENVQASGETTSSCRPTANAAPASMRAPQACSSSPLTNNNTSHWRASSMQLTQCLDPTSAVGWLPGELPGQSIHEHMTEETGAPRRRKDQRLNSGVPQTPPAGKAIAIRRPNAPSSSRRKSSTASFAFFARRSVVDGVSVSNVNRRDPQPPNLFPIGRDLEPTLVFRRGLPLRPHVVLTAPIDPKAFDARHSGPYTYVVLTATPEPPTGEFAFRRILRTDAPVLPDCVSNRKPGKFGFLTLEQCSSD